MQAAVDWVGRLRMHRWRAGHGLCAWLENLAIREALSSGKGSYPRRAGDSPLRCGQSALRQKRGGLRLRPAKGRLEIPNTYFGSPSEGDRSAVSREFERPGGFRRRRRIGLWTDGFLPGEA